MSKELKILINNEEVVCDKQISIKEEMLSTSSTILKNCYPKSWENDKDYTSKFYFPKDYSKCKIFNETYYPEKPGLIVSGSNLSIEYDNTLNYDINELKGNTEQQGSPTPSSQQPINNVTGLQTIEVVGKNLFDKNSILDNQALDSTTGSTVSNNARITSAYIPVKSSTQYIFSHATDISTNGRALCYYNSNKTYISGAEVSQLSGGIFTTPSNCKYIRFGYVKTGNYADLMLEQGNQATTYEEYKGQKYEINLGKNLFDKDNANTLTAFISNSSTTINSTTAGLKLLYIPIIGGKTYTISKVSSLVFRVATSINTPAIGVSCTNAIVDETATHITITTPTNANYLLVNYYRGISPADTLTEQEILDSIQIEVGSQATSYSEYFTPIELNKIPNTDYQDRIYKQNNKWYIEKKIGKVVLDGSENYSLNTEGFTITGSDWNNLTNNNCMSNSILLSNYYKNYTTYANLVVQNYGIGIIYSNVKNLYIRNTDISSVANFKTWLTTHNTEIEYVLNEPEITEITNEELINQLDSIKLLNGTNNINVISSNLSGILNIHYNYKEAYTVEDLIFCGCVKNTGNISLNPREPHYVDLQILDFKTLLSEGETLNYVIANKTISEAISQVINSISDYGFVLGNINLSNSDEIIGAYSTLNKTAYDVFQYFADITQSKWTTRMIDEDTIAIDFYDPLLMEKATTIENTETYAENNKIIDISFNYSTNDYRNKQIITSDEVFANITQTETILADGYAKNFNCQNKIGIITEIKTNGVASSFITKNEQELGLSADYIYTPGKETLESSNVLSSGTIISITYYPIVKGREIVLNTVESSRISNQINRKGTISRYENRNDTTSSQELIKIGQSYIKYKGKAEITLKIVSENDILNVGQIVNYEAPLEELAVDYMVKSKTIDIYIPANKIFYTYELSNNFNSENAINYFDNQRAKNQGNIGEGETIIRNIDIENTVLIKFYDTDIQEVEVGNYTSLDFSLDGVII